MGVTGLAEKNYDYYQYFANQNAIANILTYIVFIMLPIMLCGIPCIAICCGGKKHDEHEDEFQNVKAQNQEEEQQLLRGDGGEGGAVNDVETMLRLHGPKAESHDNLGEIFIHQVIETIEFVLGCISNTASYLRLWALSLAHGQLAEVFLNLVFTCATFVTPHEMSVGAATAFFFIAGFGFMAATTAVLLMMDALEVFLHTMRLHWVEFMGKFYKGTGVPFKPFSFAEVYSKERARVDSSSK